MLEKINEEAMVKTQSDSKRAIAPLVTKLGCIAPLVVATINTTTMYTTRRTHAAAAMKPREPPAVHSRKRRHDDGGNPAASRAKKPRPPPINTNVGEGCVRRFGLTKLPVTDSGQQQVFRWDLPLPRAPRHKDVVFSKMGSLLGKKWGKPS